MESSISDLLEKLNTIQDHDDTGLIQWCDELCSFYEKNSRHSYSDITTYIVREDGGIEYIYRILPLLKSAENRLTGKPDMKEKVTKLIDHIRLELIRMEYLDKMRVELNQSIVDQYLELEQEKTEEFSKVNSKILDVTTRYSDMEARRIELEKKMEEMADSFKEIKSELKVTKDEMIFTEKLAKKTRHKLNNMQKEYITILGIFASIVMAFIGGTVFSTSVLQNIANASIYRISFIAVGIAAVIINLIYILVRFIQELNKEEGEIIKYPLYMLLINSVMFTGVVFIFIAWLFQVHPIGVK